MKPTTPTIMKINPKKTSFILTLLAAVMFPFSPFAQGATHKVMIVLQENGGLENPLMLDIFNFPDEIANNTQLINVLSGAVDTIAETFENVNTTLQGADRYDKIIPLTDVNCTRQKLLTNLIAETVAGNQIDLFVLGHGGDDRLELHNETLEGGDSGTIRSLLTDARTQKGKNFNFKLRLVYMCNCHAATCNDDWLAIGARTSVGTPCDQMITEPMIALFLNKYVKENKTVATAVFESFSEAKSVWEKLELAFNMGWDTPFAGDDKCTGGIKNRMETSLMVAAGDVKLRFNQSTGDQTLTGPVIGPALDAIAWNAINFLNNFTGAAVPEGRYILKCYAFRNQSYRALNWPWADKNNATPESGLETWTIGNHPGNNIFTIEKQLPVGYRIKMATGKTDLLGNTVVFNMEVPLVDSDGQGINQDGGNANMQGINIAYSGQIWLFYKIAGHDNIYVIINSMSGKVLDAADSCQQPPHNCGLKQWHPISGDQTQLWVLEKQ